MEPDYNKLRLAAVRDMATTLGEIGDSRWEQPSLCHGWQIRHIPSHIVTGYLFSPEQVAEVAAQVGSVLEAAKRGAIEFASTHEVPAIVEAFERNVAQPEPSGIAAMPSIEGFIGSKDRASGLRLEATDVDWAWGRGPLVRGSANALLGYLGGSEVTKGKGEKPLCHLLAVTPGVRARRLPGELPAAPSSGEATAACRRRWHRCKPPRSWRLLWRSGAEIRRTGNCDRRNR